MSQMARQGVWTPWARVLCAACDYTELKGTFRAPHYPRRLEVLERMDRTAEIQRPDGDLLATCEHCDRDCWVRSDVALLQRVGLMTSELDWKGPFGWELQQTGGMCSALVFSTTGRIVVVTAMDETFIAAEYVASDENWEHTLRLWESEDLHNGSDLKPDVEIDSLVAECARKVIEFIRSEAPS